MNLLLDLGNTRLKWAVGTDPATLQVHAVAWDSVNLRATLDEVWSELPSTPARTCIASVASAEKQDMVLTRLRALGVVVEVLQTPARACGVINAYTEPQRLGVDRFLSMVAARHAGYGSCIVASCGTALTLDAVHADGRHLGGLIAPGPRLMRRSVLGATAKVLPQHEGACVNAANTTEGALDSGCWHAAAGLVERFAANMAGDLGGAPQWVLCGGDAGQLSTLLSHDVHVHTDAVLRGLAVWVRENPQVL